MTDQVSLEQSDVDSIRALLLYHSVAKVNDHTLVLDDVRKP